MFFIFFFSRP